jgi:hypothetical protein
MLAQKLREPENNYESKITFIIKFWLFATAKEQLNLIKHYKKHELDNITSKRYINTNWL